MTLAERLRAARERLGLSQPDASSKFGIPLSTYRKYETGPSEPGSQAIAGISLAGINANWLLTGEGPMLLADLQAPASPPGVFDPARLRLAIETVEEGLEATRRTMMPDRKAELVTAVYDLFDEDVSEKSRDRVLRLVKSAA